MAGSVLVLLLLSPVFMMFRMTWGLWVGCGHEEGGSGQLQLHKLTARGLWLCSLPRPVSGAWTPPTQGRVLTQDCPAKPAVCSSATSSCSLTVGGPHWWDRC